ncbi:MAG: bile acid:sodium symporter family protein [Flavobacteriaceae bacterium]
MFTRYFPLWVSSCALMALFAPPLFTWFSGPWITYGLGGIMLGMGLTLRWADFSQVLTAPLWIFTGMLLQFSVMPLLGWGLGLLFNLPPFFAVGLILVACCPGGTASNVIVYLAKANVALSVAMTTCSTLAAIVLTPLLTASLSGSYLDVDAWGLFYSTVKVVLLPVALGTVLNQYFPRLTQKAVPYAPPIAVILIVLIVASIIGQGREIILTSGINLILAIMMLHLFGFIIGYFFSYFILKDKAVCKTISIEVGMQNSGLGAVLARENFINPATAIPSAISSLVHSIYGSIFVAIFKQTNKKKSNHA